MPMNSERRPVRMLLVDHSSADRRALSEALLACPGVETAGTAATVRSAISRLEELKPDVIVARCELSGEAGSLLRSVSQSSHPVPVVIFDEQLQAGSPRSLDARLNGAAACVNRPAGSSAGYGQPAIAELAEVVRTRLLPAVLEAVAAGSAVIPASRRPSPSPTIFSSPSRSPTAPSAATVSPAATKPGSVAAGIVAIASSTGGPDALVTVLSALPREFSIPVVIAQHMPSEFTASLAERLATLTGRRVKEGRDTAPLTDADIWIAPGGRHLLVEKRDRTAWLRLSDAAPENSCRPSADVLFRSVAEAFGALSLGVVLTGMGQDGMQGCRAIRLSGGQVVVQDQATSVVWAMPRAVAEAGLADAILPLNALAAEIQRRCRRSLP